MHVSDEYSELGQELKNGLVIDPPRFCKKFQNLAPMTLMLLDSYDGFVVRIKIYREMHL